MRRILPVIIISQFFCTSLWFAGNAVMPDIVKKLQLSPGFLAHLTSAVQLGFITGTLVFALLTVADRFSPSKVFFACSVIAAVCNLGIILENIQAAGLIFSRFSTGFFLAGIYPVGMKIASDHYKEGLGKSLGFLVGALVMGTAFPHLLKSLALSLPWKYVVLTTSLLSVLGGSAMLLLVPDGPFRKPAQQLRFTTFLILFREPKLRAAAFGYFGHMWELYAFWAFVPVMLAAYQKQYPEPGLNIPLLAFLVIGSGSIACAISGLLSQTLDAGKIAGMALFVSAICCLLSPFFLLYPAPSIFLLFLFIWSMAVIADSPMFSTLVAYNAPAAVRGSVLTMVNCMGFALTIISIQLVNLLVNHIHTKYLYMVLSIGPIAGLWALFKNEKDR